jgi:hypothetical protein
MFSKLSPFSNFEKVTLDLSEKKLLVRNMWKVYMHPTSASDFFSFDQFLTFSLKVSSSWPSFCTAF